MRILKDPKNPEDPQKIRKFQRFHPISRCVVWTGDSRVFFYNPSTRTSVWERPEDLVGRADVDKAVTTIPEQLVGTKDKETVKETGNLEKLTGDVMKTKKMEESSDEEEVPPKKLKIETIGEFSGVFKLNDF